jgi:hypothetical protein
MLLAILSVGLSRADECYSIWTDGDSTTLIGIEPTTGDVGPSVQLVGVEPSRVTGIANDGTDGLVACLDASLWSVDPTSGVASPLDEACVAIGGGDDGLVIQAAVDGPPVVFGPGRAFLGDLAGVAPIEASAFAYRDGEVVVGWHAASVLDAYDPEEGSVLDGYDLDLDEVWVGGLSGLRGSLYALLDERADSGWQLAVFEGRPLAAERFEVNLGSGGLLAGLACLAE